MPIALSQLNSAETKLIEKLARAHNALEMIKDVLTTTMQLEWASARADEQRWLQIARDLSRRERFHRRRDEIEWTVCRMQRLAAWSSIHEARGRRGLLSEYDQIKEWAEKAARVRQKLAGLLALGLLCFGPDVKGLVAAMVERFVMDCKLTPDLLISHCRLRRLGIHFSHSCIVTEI